MVLNVLPILGPGKRITAMTTMATRERKVTKIVGLLLSAEYLEIDILLLQLN